MARRGKRPRGREGSRDKDAASIKENWVPKTHIGQMVKDGLITSIEEVFRNSYRIDDINIVDILLPKLDEQVLWVGRVQKQTDAGRKTVFVATAAVGNYNGIVGVGNGRGAGMGTAIRAAINEAKLNIIPIKRGCGSWECDCSNPHSIPFKVDGKKGSVSINLYPGPSGLGLVCGDAVKKVLKLAGIRDVWSKTTGDTRTTKNYCHAAFDALKQTYIVIHPSEW
ncbi:MAG: 30S ribosomal protein S5 [Candidatus Hodarchaeales archaeon]